MKIERYGGRGYESNCYLIVDDEETPEAGWMFHMLLLPYSW